MNTRRYRILCGGLFRGFLFINDHNNENYHCKAGTIAPFEIIRNLEGDSEVVGQEHITDIYLPDTTDEFIKNDLVGRVNLQNCANLEIVEY